MKVRPGVIINFFLLVTARCHFVDVDVAVDVDVDVALRYVEHSSVVRRTLVGCFRYYLLTPCGFCVCLLSPMLSWQSPGACHAQAK